jgi:hypothetical protein
MPISWLQRSEKLYFLSDSLAVSILREEYHSQDQAQKDLLQKCLFAFRSEYCILVLTETLKMTTPVVTVLAAVLLQRNSEIIA